MNVIILLGSGASIPAGYPPVADVTEGILSDETISFADCAGKGRSSSEEVLAFLRWLRTVAEARYTSDAQRRANYEDIYFLASQIRDDLRNEFDNPAVRPLIEKVIVEFLLLRRDCFLDLRNPLEKLASDATDHIRRHVASCLGKPLEQLQGRLRHLDFIAEGIRDAGARNIAFLTLNHDLLLETYLDAQNIHFTDGFSKKANSVGIREWEAFPFSDADGFVRVLKLHGGINWYRFRPDGAEPWSEDYAGIPTADFSSGRVDEKGRRHCWLDPLPMFLIGTFNKLSSYTDPVYLEIYHQAFRAVRRADALLVIGYGFGDKGINKLVTEWVYRSPQRRLVVVDRYADTLWKRTRGGISGIWHDLLDSRRLVPLQRDLQNNNLPWQEIVCALRSGL